MLPFVVGNLGRRIIAQVHVDLRRQEAVDVEGDGVFPIGKEIIIVCEEKQARTVFYVGCPFPRQRQLGIATDFIMDFLPDRHIELDRVDFGVDTGLEIV